MDSLLTLIGEFDGIALSPPALVAYLVTAIIYVFSATNIRRQKQLLRRLESLPAKDRRLALRDEIGFPVPDSITPEAWIIARVHRYYFLAFLATCLVLVLWVLLVARPWKREDTELVSHEQECHRIVMNASSYDVVKKLMKCTEATEIGIVDLLYTAGMKEACFISIPSRWSVERGEFGMEIVATPGKSDYFSKYNFEFSVVVDARRIDPEKYEGDQASEEFWIVDSPNKKSLVCDVRNKKYSLIAENFSMVKDMGRPRTQSDFLDESGAVPQIARTFVIETNVHYEDGNDSQQCLVPVLRDEENQHANIEIDSIVHIYTNISEEYEYVRFHCSADASMPSKSFDKLCSLLITEATTNERFVPSACDWSGSKLPDWSEVDES